MILYAYRNKTAAAFCKLRVTNCGDFEIAYLKVEPEHRGKGIATQLLNRAKRVAEREQRWLVGFLDPDGTGLTREQERAWLKRHGFTYEPKYDLSNKRSKDFSHLIGQWNRPKPVMVWVPEILRPNND